MQTKMSYDEIITLAAKDAVVRVHGQNIRGYSQDLWEILVKNMVTKIQLLHYTQVSEIMKLYNYRG